MAAFIIYHDAYFQFAIKIEIKFTKTSTIQRLQSLEQSTSLSILLNALKILKTIKFKAFGSRQA